MLTPWQSELSPQFQRDQKKFLKKHPDELTALIDNLGTIIHHLNLGVPLKQIKFGWLHPEPNGVLAITEKGGHGKNLMASRLYIFPDHRNKKIILITVGDKKVQDSNIDYCKKFVKNIRNK